MLRIHFTSRDLENVRIARRPDPLWEIVCSICCLQHREGTLAFSEWRRSAGALLRRGGAAREAASILRSLIPRAAYFPDFLTPPVEEDSEDLGIYELGPGVERVLATPKRQLRHELSLLSEGGGLPWAGTELARGDTAHLARLGSQLHTYHKEFIAPSWGRVGAAIAADTALRTRALAHGGTRALMGSLRPMAVWEPPVLTARYPVERDLYLGGRGLLLVPSYFCWRDPITLVDEGMLPVLIYPIDRAAAQSTTSIASLARMLGPARAALLYEAAVRPSASTSELAEATGFSLPNVSQQLTVLREGGLVTSRRDGKRVRHAATPLGRRLLQGV